MSTSTDKAVTLPTIEIKEKPSDASVSEAADTVHDLERIREESAAIKAQTTFRGYLARRAFRALRGLIRLQALVRGQTVRRQAGGSLRCLQAIIRLQALVRAHQVRMSEQGLVVQERLEYRRRQNPSRGNELERKSSSIFVVNSASRSEKLLTNAFARQVNLKFALVVQDKSLALLSFACIALILFNYVAMILILIWTLL